MNDAYLNDYEELAAPFPSEVEKQLRKGGAVLTYIPISEVVNRMNRVIGIANWDTEVVSVGRDPEDLDYVVAHVRITARFSEKTTVKAGFGGTKIKRTKSGEILDLGDDYKGAVSDAIKKAAQQLGVGLYLARADEALRMDEEFYAAPDPAKEEISKLWSIFMEHVSTMNDDGKLYLSDFWSTMYMGEPKPNLDTVTKEQVENLVGACVTFKLGAEIIKEES